jgi:hypothetical protein
MISGGAQRSVVSSRAFPVLLPQHVDDSTESTAMQRSASACGVVTSKSLALAASRMKAERDRHRQVRTDPVAVAGQQSREPRRRRRPCVCLRRMFFEDGYCNLHKLRAQKINGVARLLDA